jgi:hypothetical protein
LGLLLPTAPFIDGLPAFESAVASGCRAADEVATKLGLPRRWHRGCCATPP